MANSTRGVTVVAKLLGGRKIETESKAISKSIEGTGGAVKKADEEAGKASKGWELFSAKAKKAAKENEKTHHSLLKAAAGIGAGYLGVSTLTGIVSKTGEAAEETHAFSAKTGLSAQKSLDMVAALKALGINQTAISVGYKTIAKNEETAIKQNAAHALGLAKAVAVGKTFTGMLGTQADAFSRLNINVETFHKLPLDKQVSIVTERLSGMKNQQEKVYLATTLMGKGALALMPALNNSNLGLKAMEKTAEELFPKLGKDGPAALEKVRVEQVKSKLSWEGLQLTIGMKVVPALTKGYAAVSELTKSVIAGHGPWGTIEKTIGGMVGVLTPVVTWLGKSRTAVKVLTIALGLLGVAWGVEKIVKFYRAVKSLWLLQGIANLAGGAWKRVGISAGEQAAQGLGSSSVKSKMGAMGGVLGAVMGGAFALVMLNQYKDQIDKYLAKELPAPLAGFFKKGAHPINVTGLNQALYKKAGAQYEAAHGHTGAFYKTMKPPKLAHGGTIRVGGSVIVGDRGPELLSLPPAARVDPLLPQGRGVGDAPGSWRGSSGDLVVICQLDRKEVARAVVKDLSSQEARR
jgi:hypothetical protein